jgi:hypothetical protein
LILAFLTVALTQTTPGLCADRILPVTGSKNAPVSGSTGKTILPVGLSTIAHSIVLLVAVDGDTTPPNCSGTPTNVVSGLGTGVIPVTATNCPIVIVKSFVNGMAPEGKLASASPLTIVALTTTDPDWPHGMDRGGEIVPGVSAVIPGDTDMMDHAMGAPTVALDGNTVAKLSRLSIEPIATDVGTPTMSDTGTNDGGASTTTTHSAVCPAAVLTVIVAVPGATANILNWGGLPSTGGTGVTIATFGLLLDAVRAWFVASDGKTIAVIVAVVTDPGVAGASRRTADGVRLTPVVPTTGSVTYTINSAVALLSVASAVIVATPALRPSMTPVTPLADTVSVKTSAMVGSLLFHVTSCLDVLTGSTVAVTDLVRPTSTQKAFALTLTDEVLILVG